MEWHAHDMELSFERQLKVKSFSPLKVRNHIEQVPRLRVALRTEHAHETLRGRVSQIAQFLEADGCIDVITENRFAGVEIAG